MKQITEQLMLCAQSIKADEQKITSPTSSITEQDKSRQLLFTHLPSVVRLSIESPFADVRQHFTEFLLLRCVYLYRSDVVLHSMCTNGQILLQH